MRQTFVGEKHFAKSLKKINYSHLCCTKIISFILQMEMKAGVKHGHEKTFYLVQIYYTRSSKMQVNLMSGKMMG